MCGIVAVAVGAQVLDLGEEGLIGGAAAWLPFIEFDKAADLVVDVAGHVHEMACARHQRGQTIGIRFGTLRSVGSLPQMNVEMDGAGVIRVGLESALKQFVDFLLAAL